MRTVINEERWSYTPSRPKSEPHDWSNQRDGQNLGPKVDRMKNIFRVFEIGDLSWRRWSCALYRRLGWHFSIQFAKE